MSVIVERVPAAGEFRARPRIHPRWVIRFLGVVTFLYGLTLSFTLPWTVQEAVFDPSNGILNKGPLAAIWGTLLIVIGAIVMIRWIIVQALAFYEHDRVRRSPPVQITAANAPFVSILVPAFNESDTVINAITSLVTLDYPNYEVIFVDDGSTDDTYVKAFAMAGKYKNCTLHVYTKPNGGKWSTLNFAFHKAKGDLLLCVDADSGLAKDALKVMVPRIFEKGIVGVAGQVTIRNRVNLLTRLQAAEYLLGNGGMRMALSFLGAVTVVPGPIGLYTREIMEEVARLPGNQPSDKMKHHGEGLVYGPLSGETFAEDFQLSLSALALGGRIVYEPRAYAYTKCPEDVGTLLSQRYRWMRGTWQVYRLYVKNLRKISKSKVPLLGIVMTVLYPVDIYLIPLLNFFFWMAIGFSVASGFAMDFVVAWIGSVGLLNIMTVMIYVLEQDDEIGLIPLTPILDIYQSLLINSAWVIAAIDEVRGAGMRWH